MRIVARLAAAAAVFTVLGLTGAMAATEQPADPPVVIELFTSQGCSSCPPADELIHELAQREDVIPLALHVDYWDYIGWKDAFARPEHTTRQKGYAYAAGQRTIYTPQMIVNGQDHVVGFKPMQLAELIERHRDSPKAARLKVTRDGDKLVVTGEAGQALGECLVQLVRYMPEATVDIRSGENAGRTMRYANIVTDWQVLGTWDGGEPLRLEAELDGDEPAVIIVQAKEYGPIIAAARVP